MDAFISTQAFRSPFLACPAMGRSRVRGKKQTSTAARQDHASGEEEKIPVKRRGRPLKLVRNDSPQKEAHDFDQLGDEDYTDGILSDKHINAPPSVINTGIKRTRTSDIDDNHGMAKQEIGKLGAEEKTSHIGLLKLASSADEVWCTTIINFV
ncbi:hypothetical protein ACET3Z_020692 [Daucus carota]